MPGSRGGLSNLPTCLAVNSSAFSESVGCNLISFATKNVRRYGLQSPMTSIFARPPTRTHFPDGTLNVMGSTCLYFQLEKDKNMNQINVIHPLRIWSTYFFGTTIFNSSGVSLSVKLPGISNPGVSYKTLPSPSSILMNLRVVPGKGLVVTEPFHLLAFPARFFPPYLSFLS